jgi:hypothetical protein
MNRPGQIPPSDLNERRTLVGSPPIAPIELASLLFRVMAVSSISHPAHWINSRGLLSFWPREYDAMRCNITLIVTESRREAQTLGRFRERVNRGEMCVMIQRKRLVALIAVVICAGELFAQIRPAAEQKLHFEISFPAAIRPQPVTGRVYVMISRTNEREPRLQIGRTGVPFFGHDVENLKPSESAVIDENDPGSPLESIRDLPAEDFFVQGFVNIYSEFRRLDGHVLWMHDDQWEGQRWERSPGNLYSTVQRIHLDPQKGGVIKLIANQIIPPVAVPPDTEWVKRIKFQSTILTKFWGRPVYLGATVLLPRDYDSQTASYPVNYLQGHFSQAAPLGFEIGNDLYKEWVKDDFPRMLVATFQHPNPYFDDSYAVNSVNVGPYGDAIMQELIPEVEKRFRVIKEPYARILSGGSTGGWEALALQLFHPDFFGGAWAYCPDSVEFGDVEGIDAYKDGNAFYKQFEWRRVPTINTRETNGQVRMTSQQRIQFELTSGTRGRSGQQLDIWQAVFGPIGKDGYFEPLFNATTGSINPTVAQYWKEHFDLKVYLERNWATLGPKLMDKLYIYAGNADNFFLNNSTKVLDDWMKTTVSPHYEGFFLYGDGKGHCWSGAGTTAERLKEMAQFVARKKPQGTTTPWWRY